jgi:hypothetical protein
MAKIATEKVKNKEPINIEVQNCFTHKFFQAYKEVSNSRI